MGNQNTSGLIEVRAVKEEAVEKEQKVNSGHELGKEWREDESKNVQPEGGGIQADESCGIQNGMEEANGQVSEKRNDVPEGLSSTVEVKESTLEEGVSVLNDGICKSQGGTPKNDSAFESEPKQTSAITISTYLPHGDVALVLQTDQSMAVEEIQEAQEFENSCQTDVESDKVDATFTQDMNTTRAAGTGADHDIEKSKDEYIVNDTAYDEPVSLGTCMDDTRNGVSDERGKGEENIHDERGKGEENILDDPSKISWQDSCAGEDEKRNKFLTQDEEKPMLEDEISEALNMSMDQRDQAHEQTEMVESDVQSWDGGQPVVKEGSIFYDETNPKDEQPDDDSLKIKHKDQDQVPDSLKIKHEDPDQVPDSLKIEYEDPDQVPDQTEEGLTVKNENKEDNQPNDENIIEQDMVITTSIEKGQVQSQSQSSVEINVDPTLLEPALHEGLVSNIVPEPEIPPYSTIAISQGLDFEPKSRDIDVGMQVVLKKSPSFDFGIVPYDARSEESDQTPLLYNDRSAAPRRFSSCSTLGFQSRSVQTNYLENSLQYEAVEVEEKTIQMERSNSESSRVKAVTIPNNDEKENVIVNATQEDCDLLSPKGTEKKKTRSSLFTTCICCAEAIG